MCQTHPDTSFQVHSDASERSPWLSLEGTGGTRRPSGLEGHHAVMSPNEPRIQQDLVLGRELRSWGYLKSLQNRERFGANPQVSKHILVGYPILGLQLAFTLF